MSHSLQSTLESGQEARIVQIDFSDVFDRVNHLGFSIRSALWVLEIRCLYIDAVSFKRSQHVVVDDCRSKLVNVVSGVSQGRVWGLLVFLLYTSEFFSILESS